MCLQYMAAEEKGMEELELYVHIPFCKKKCSYCDFLSAPAEEDVQNAYLKQMDKEISAVSKDYKDVSVTSVFIGGGTPSILEASKVQHLMQQLRTHFALAENAEISIECNPGTLDAGKLRAYQSSGINRLSIGMQSADARELRMLGRIHTHKQSADSYMLAREMGFKNINIDLISALPGQKASDYERTLLEILKLRPEHISAYSLIIEEGTPFFEQYQKAQLMREKGKAQSLLPSEEEERAMYVLTKELLKSEGYMRYEISNYALDGFSCRHNIGYWTRKNYLGIGLGAASLIENVRFSNSTDLKAYLDEDFLSEWHVHKEQMDLHAQMEEFMFLGLRMMCGVSSQEFYKQFSRTLEEVYGAVLEEQLKKGFIKKTARGYSLTDFGIDISNYVMSEYLIEKS